MFNRAYYTLQAKKTLWFALMVGSAAIAVMTASASTWLSPIFIIGMTVGIGVYHLKALLPNRIRGLGFPLLAPLISLAMPGTMLFCLGYFGLILYLTMSADKNLDFFKKNHKLGEDATEVTDLEILKKLEHKTNIKCETKLVCEVDAKNCPPNAGAAWLYDGNVISIFSSMFSAGLSAKERKAIYAHEFGHVNHRDSIFHSVTKCLYWMTAACAYVAFNFHIALLVHFVSSFSYFAISRIDELLADQFAARHANPSMLSSGFDKLDQFGKNLSDKAQMPAVSDLPRALYYVAKKAVGMSSHPSTALRQAYLKEYATEKRIANCKPYVTQR